MSYPLDELFREVAYVAYHFHWSRDEIEAMPHERRRRWVREIAAINEARNQAEEA